MNFNEMHVSLLPHLLPDTRPGMSDEEKLRDFGAAPYPMPTVPLKKFLEGDEKTREFTAKARSLKDLTQRRLFIGKYVPHIVVAAKVLNRDFSRPYERLVMAYNSLIALEVYASDDRDRVLDVLKSKPYVWYITVNLDGDMFVAIVKLDNCNYKLHYDCYLALRLDLQGSGLRVSERSGNLLAVMAQVYDPDAWYNDDCIPFSLPTEYRMRVREE